MNGLLCWAVFAARLTRYFVYRLGLAACPPFLDVRVEVATCIGHLLRWKTRLRVVGAENCPKSGPAVFAGNHQKIDDPLTMWKAVYEGSGHGILSHFMSRDDFFAGLKDKLVGRLLKNRFFDLDELTVLLGTFQINRESVRISQMKPFFRVLKEGKCFIMYPTGTRSRTGAFMEYRDGVEEPGGVGFFLAQAQRSKPEVAVPAVPLGRTHNPVNKHDALAFGEPLYLPPDASREEQRDFDLRLAVAMAQEVEINVAHLTSAILYLRCLHRIDSPVTAGELENAIRGIVDGLEGRHVDPAARNDLPRELKRTLRFLEKGGMLRRTGDSVTPNAEAILAAPEPDSRYKKTNPVKHLTNQIIHLGDVCAALERVALRTAPEKAGD
jgi:1-acyl-sn-glycerol-3-phosphate acyltransferase